MQAEAREGIPAKSKPENTLIEDMIKTVSEVLGPCIFYRDALLHKYQHLFSFLSSLKSHLHLEAQIYVGTAVLRNVLFPSFVQAELS